MELYARNITVRVPVDVVVGREVSFEARGIEDPKLGE